jgi:hypothetical protein
VAPITPRRRMVRAASFLNITGLASAAVNLAYRFAWLGSLYQQRSRPPEGYVGRAERQRRPFKRGLFGLPECAPRVHGQIATVYFRGEKQLNNHDISDT